AASNFSNSSNSLSATTPGAPATQPPAIAFFSANPATIAQGAASTLSWSVTGATSLTIDNGVGIVTGLTSRPVSPALTTTYTLTAANSAGMVTARTTVTVTAGSGGSDTQPPSVPTLQYATPVNGSQVSLGWTASTDNVGVAGYRVLR